MTPDRFTNEELFLEVGEGHKLYVMDWGKADSKTVIISLHGGPGAGSSDSHKQRFDPSRQRVIFFDQRGSGRSLPYGELANNTTNELVADITKLADHFKLSQFILAGRSWGSLLALVYAISYPKRVKALLIGGVLTGTKQEQEYLESGGFKQYFPDVWDEFISTVPKDSRLAPITYHAKHMLDGDQSKVQASARAYNRLMNSLLRLDERAQLESDQEIDVAPIKIELSYYLNNFYVDPGYVLKNALKIKAPVWIVQGRYDMVCPPVSAYLLDEALPNSYLLWTMAGHSSDRSNYDVTRTVALTLTE